MYDVLVVEDEPQFRKFISKVLISKGFKVKEASNGDEAKNLLNKNSYNVVINDLRMPGLSGKEITRFIHTMIDPETPVIIITGYEEDWPEIEATSEHVFYYMKKGEFTPEELVKVVRNAVSYKEEARKRVKKIMDTIEIEKLEATGKLAIGIAHEINNPLQGIVSTIHKYISNTSNNDGVNEEIKRDLELVMTAINRIKDTIENLNHLYRSSKKIKTGKTIHSMLEYITSFCMPIAHEYRVNLKLIKNFQKSNGSLMDFSHEFHNICTSEIFEILFHTTINLLSTNIESLTINEYIDKNDVFVDFSSSVINISRFKSDFLPWIEFARGFSKKLKLSFRIDEEKKSAVVRIFFLHEINQKTKSAIYSHP